MKKVLFLMLFLMILGTASVSAQVRIGGNAAPHGAAVLDLNVDNSNVGNKGALALPRVSLVNNTAPLNGATPLNGMLVYNTGDVPNLPAGIYYWYSSGWRPLSVSLILSANPENSSLLPTPIPITWTEVMRSDIMINKPAGGVVTVDVPGLRYTDLCTCSNYGISVTNHTNTLYVSTWNTDLATAAPIRVICYRPVS